MARKKEGETDGVVRPVMPLKRRENAKYCTVSFKPQAAAAAAQVAAWSEWVWDCGARQQAAPPSRLRCPHALASAASHLTK